MGLSRSTSRNANLEINRRRLMAGSASAAVLAVTSPRIVFGQDASPAASPAAGGIVSAGVEGVPDLYLSYPAPKKTYDGVPGKGGSVRAFTIGYQPPPSPRDQNQYWQELEKRLGVKWEIDIAPQPNYGEKSAAYLAGGDLPDLFYLNPGQNATQQYQAMAQGAFLDLTQYLTGDALQQYQNLKNIPQYMWDNNTFQGKIIAVPNPTGRAGSDPFCRTDWAEAVGIEPSDPEQLGKMLAAFSGNDPDGDGSPNTWGMARFGGGWLGWDNTIAYRAYKIPNNWRLNDDGTLTNAIETDEYKAAIEWLTGLYKAGAYHPDAASYTFSDDQNAFIGGSIGLHTEGTGSFFGKGNVGYKQRQANPKATIKNVPNVAVDGGPGYSYNRSGAFGMVGIPSSVTDENRIVELLHILDYLNAPFGTEEREFLNSGIEGVHYERNDQGVPITNDKLNEQRGDLVYLMGPMPYLYSAEDPDEMVELQGILKTAVENGVDDPTMILFSQTNVDQGPLLSQLGMDSITPIITGRDPLENLQAAIDQWKSQGGDQIRTEFQDALQQQG